MEVYVKFPVIILFGFLILSVLISNNRFGQVSLVDFCYLGIKFITLYSIERSQENVPKFIVEGSVSAKLWLELRFLSSTTSHRYYVRFCERCGCIEKLPFKYEIKLLDKT